MYPREFGRPSTLLLTAASRKARVVGPAYKRKCPRFFTPSGEKPSSEQNSVRIQNLFRSPRPRRSVREIVHLASAASANFPDASYGKSATTKSSVNPQAR